MSRKEVPRAGLLKAALAGKISNAQGAVALHLSVRQFQRLKRRYAADGAAGRHREGNAVHDFERPIRHAQVLDGKGRVSRQGL